MTRSSFSEFLRFAIVGTISAAIDFGVLNLLSIIFGIYSGPIVGVFNIASFSVAVVNSYFMNKYWTFKANTGVTPIEVSTFLAVSICGLIINTAFFSLFTNYLNFAKINLHLWENISKAGATGFSLIWNFIGYKVFVFKSKA